MAVDNNPSSAKAYTEIHRMVLERVLKPGQALAVPELAEQLSMSVTPVRDAIRKLESEGLLEVVPRRGTFVRSFELEDLIIGYESAEALEGMAAYLVAEQIADNRLERSEIDHLDKLVREMKKFLGESDIHRWSELDSSFHGAILDLCNNHTIRDFWLKLRTQMDCVLWFITPLHVDRNRSTKEHKLIIDALRSGNATEARRISQEHKNTVRNTLIKLVANNFRQTGRSAQAAHAGIHKSRKGVT